MAIKANDTEYDVIKNNPLTTSLFNYGANSGSNVPPPESFHMITEITEEPMITESGDYMITEF